MKRVTVGCGSATVVGTLMLRGEAVWEVFLMRGPKKNSKFVRHIPADAVEDHTSAFE